ncbi:unnamed protein product [Symbiodinium necroappetens]|uniref:Uncharacterized protein n=1 Tax=Symbiodinium necroappetens TaxID=1628268 RepID=A0A812N5U2_9DINO|nr:unnamed protein product [Symbiodinium necroappetens]
MSTQQDASEFFTMLTSQGAGDLQAVQWQGRTDGLVVANAWSEGGFQRGLLWAPPLLAVVLGAEVTSGHYRSFWYCSESGALLTGDDAVRPTQASASELTQGFLLHEEQLALIQQQISIVFKFPEDSSIARSLMKAVREWQAEHKAGTSHPWGSCSHYTAASLLKELSKITDPPKNFCSADNKYFQKVVQELGPDPHESLVHMVSYCSARLSAKKEHVILDFRPVLNTVLARQSEFISGLLDGCDGERLGKRAPGALVRKARGKPSDR